MSLCLCLCAPALDVAAGRSDNKPAATPQLCASHVRSSDDGWTQTLTLLIHILPTMFTQNVETLAVMEPNAAVHTCGMLS